PRLDPGQLEGGREGNLDRGLPPGQRPRAPGEARRPLAAPPGLEGAVPPGEIPVTLPIEPPYPPMEALLVDAIPVGKGWQYEPKWDGFRCLAFRDGEKVELQSKSGQPLARYFPEVVEDVRALPPSRFILDGEIVIP